MEDGQMIYLVDMKLTYKVRKGHGYTNHYRTMKIPTRMKSIDDMNRSPEMMMKLMASLKLTGKKIQDFHVVEELSRKEISRSFAHKNSEYDKQFK